MVVYKNRTTRGLFQDEFRTRLKIIHWKQFLFRKICISILFVIALLIPYASRNVQRTYTSDHASSGHLQEAVVYERFELKGVDGALNMRSRTTCGRIVSLVSPSVSRRPNSLAKKSAGTPSISIGDYTLKAVEDFSYLGSIISSNLSLDTELNKEDLGQHQVDHQQQDEGIPGLRAEHAAL